MVYFYNNLTLAENQIKGELVIKTKNFKTNKPKKFKIQSTSTSGRPNRLRKITLQSRLGQQSRLG